MSEWETLTLNSAGVQLIDCDHKTPAAVTHGRPYVGIPQIKDGRIELDGARLISEKDFVQWTRKANPQADDVVLSRRCNPGETAYVPEGLEFALGQNLVLLRANGGKVQSKFLRWLVRGPAWWEQVQQFLNVGAVFDSLKCREILDFELPIPPENEQEAITEILSSLDGKIELNRKQNRTLEDIAQALFKRWFMEFEFPDEKGRAYKSSGGTMQASELGEIPVGWRIGRLDELIGELETGSRPKGGVGHFTDGIPSIGAENITRIGEYDFGKTKYVPEEYFKNMRRGTIKDRDVLIYKDGGTPGRFDARISMFGAGFPYKTACLNEHVFRLQAKKPVYQNYLYLWFSSYAVLEELRHRGAKAAIPGINSTDVKELDFLFMDESVLEQFDEVIEPLFSKLLHNSREMAVFGKLRDTLLPKLMSGELRVA